MAEGLQEFPRGKLHNPVSGVPGIRVTFLDAAGAGVSGEDRLASRLIWFGASTPEGTSAIRLDTVWTVPAAGAHTVGIGTVGQVRLTIDGADVFDDELIDSTNVLGAALFAPPQKTFDVTAAAGGKVSLTAEYRLPPNQTTPLTAILLGEEAAAGDPAAEIAEAVENARGADVAIVVVGTNAAIESEGFDRENLDLPGRQNELVEAVAAANPRTVVVVISGSPVLMPWREKSGPCCWAGLAGRSLGPRSRTSCWTSPNPGAACPPPGRPHWRMCPC